MAKNMLTWLAVGAAVLIGGALVMKVIEIRPEPPFIGAGDYWQDQPKANQAITLA